MELFINTYIDAFLDQDISLKEKDLTIPKPADETIKIVCDKNIVENFFYNIKKLLIKLLIVLLFLNIRANQPYRRTGAG
ncbi:hypothetical protein BMS3Abin04_02392 [bacterium BMS3Abin04]|nr:hypothetical protein BMS3Abin04_02392 [bacterium BMS3Abin04]